MRSTAGAGLAGWLTIPKGLIPLSPVTAAEAEVGPELVRLNADIEPLVRRIERTPRERCFEMLVGQLRRGVSYRQFLAALFLAGIRNVSPQPPGFKFHCVFVIHAAHQLSLDAPVQDRLLPLFWVLDAFKVSQQQDVEQGDFRLAPVQGPLPAAESAWQDFHAAMEDWDEPRADRAIAALVRSRGAHEIIEGLWRYGARDYRNIGHKAIFVANSWRTLETIGWRHAEPVLRSLVLGLLDFGKHRQVNEFAFEDQAYVGNVERVKQSAAALPATWTTGAGDPAVAKDLLATLRTAGVQESCQATLELLNGGQAAQSVWDAAHLAAGELMMQQPGIYGIHTVTSINALRYAFETSARPETRLLMLLQGIGWMSQFRHFMASRPQGLLPVDITQLQPDSAPDDPQTAAEEILALVSTDAPRAASKAMALAQRHPEPGQFAQAAYGLIFRKGTDAHDYKYAAAVFEDYRAVSPAWRPHMLATAAYYLRGSTLPDSPVMQRAQAALGDSG